MSQSATPLRDFLAANPKWIGVLFWMTVLLTQAGLTAGNSASDVVGP